MAAKKILIIFLSGLGNSILLRPTLKALALSNPLAEIDLLFEDPIITEVFKYDRFIRNYFRWNNSIINRVSLLLTLRWRNYDHVVVTFESNGWKTALFARAVSRFSLGYWSGRWVDRLYRSLLPLDTSVHEVYRHFEIVKELADPAVPSPDPVNLDLHLKFPIGEFSYVSQKYSLCMKPIIVIHPGSSPQLAWKRWKLEHFIEVGRQLSRQYNARIIFVGGRSEESLVPALSNLDYPSDIMIGKLSLWETAYVIAQSAIFIGNDSGIAHLASALAAKTLALFGPSDPIKNRPLGHYSNIISTHHLCRGCEPHMSQRCGFRCLASLSVDLVVLEAQRMLGESGRKL